LILEVRDKETKNSEQQDCQVQADTRNALRKEIIDQITSNPEVRVQLDNDAQQKERDPNLGNLSHPGNDRIEAMVDKLTVVKDAYELSE
jgi:hypothetical protein